MPQLKKLLSLLFFILFLFALVQCARRGTPSGGPKDISPPELLKSEPENMTTNFDVKTITLYFDEYIKLQDIQNQLIVSPPLKYVPNIKPQGGTSKTIEITFKDTLRPNTTYTLNFGQSIVDNNEGNPNSFLTYVFSTGDYIDSLSLRGAVKDAFKKNAEEFISVMLYEIDTAYNDSTIYKYPPNYITNTLDSLPVFELKNLKEGQYKLFAIKDEGKNYVFDQNADKIGFLEDTITLPTDSVYLLNLFKEIPDFKTSVPSQAAKNRIVFGFTTLDSSIAINPITQLPDSVKTLVLRERDKDTLNFWLTPTDMDSIVFEVKNERLKLVDTFTLKTRKLAMDSLLLSPQPSSKLGFEERFKLLANTPLTSIDTSKIGIFDKDTLALEFNYSLDSTNNHVEFDFEIADNQKYSVNMLPGAIEDFFGNQNDTLSYTLSTGSYADFGNLSVNLSGAVTYPLIVQLTTDKGELKREVYLEQPTEISFNYLDVGQYALRVIFDTNGNHIWDTGDYLKNMQPERIAHFPDIFEMRANWDEVKTFVISN